MKSSNLMEVELSTGANFLIDERCLIGRSELAYCCDFSFWLLKFIDQLLPNFETLSTN
jgi:hypothetical protein